MMCAFSFWLTLFCLAMAFVQLEFVFCILLLHRRITPCPSKLEFHRLAEQVPLNEIDAYIAQEFHLLGECQELLVQIRSAPVQSQTLLVIFSYLSLEFSA